MIKENRILFGYGTIAVNCMNLELILSEIKPPQEIGEGLTGKEYEVIQTLRLKASFEELYDLKKDLFRVNKSDNKIIYFQNYILDFTEFNSKSVFVVLKAVDNAIGMELRCLAC